MELTSEIVGGALAAVGGVGGVLGLVKAVGLYIAKREEQKEAAYLAVLAAKDDEIRHLRATNEALHGEAKALSDKLVAKGEGWLERTLTTLDTLSDEIRKALERATGGK